MLLGVVSRFLLVKLEILSTLNMEFKDMYFVSCFECCQVGWTVGGHFWVKFS